MTTALKIIPGAPPPKLQKLGRRPITRAHLALARRPSLAAAANDAAEKASRALSDALGHPVSVKARLLDAAWPAVKSLSRSGVFVLVDLATVGAFAVLELERPFLAQALALLSGGRSRPSPVVELTRIEEAALGYLCLVALSGVRGAPALENALAPRLQGVTLVKDEALAHLSDEAQVMVELELSLGDLHSMARIVLPARPLQTAVETIPAERAAACPVALAQIGVDARVVLDAGDHTSMGLDALIPGDVVLLEGVRITEGQVLGPARLELLGAVLHGALHEDGFQQQEARVTRRSSNEAFAVDVEVELARFRLALGELGALESGAVFPLKMGASDPVLLKVGDRVIARAELVDIEGEVGARILNLMPEEGSLP